MAIAFDAASGFTFIGTGTSESLSHTCTGSNLILLAGVKGNTAAGGDVITGATYNSVAMTMVDKVLNATDRWLYLFMLINPSTGANNITVSASSSTDIAIGGVSYTGTAQSGQPDNFTDNTALVASSLTDTVATVADNCWLVGFFGNDGSLISAGTGTTSRGLTTGAGQFGRMMDSNGVKTPPGSFSLQATSAGNANWAGIMVSISPVAINVKHNLSLLGVGN